MQSSLLVGKNKITPDPAERFSELFQSGFHLMLTGHYAEAYWLWKKAIDLKPLPAVFFNLAICAMEAGDYAASLSYAEQAKAENKHNDLQKEQIIPDSLFKALAEKQAANNAYRQPMEEHYPLRFREYAEIRILRLMADLYCQLEQWPKVLETASLLQGKNYANVDKAIVLAKKAH